MSLRSLLPFGRDTAPVPGVRGRLGLERDPFLALHREIDRLFDDAVRGGPLEGWAGWMGSRGAWPRLDVRETTEAVEISADLPGVAPDEVEVRLEDGALVIADNKTVETTLPPSATAPETETPVKAETDETKVEAKAPSAPAWHVNERFHGAFRRVVPLPCAVIEDRVEARFDQGVLTVRLPKAPQPATAGRRIPVTTH